MWQALLFAYALSITGVPGAELMIYDNRPYPYRYEAWPVYVDMAATLSWGVFYAGGGVTVETYPVEWKDWTPTGTRYTVEAGLAYKGLRIGWRHWCQHPQQSYVPLWSKRGVRFTPRFEGSEDHLFIELRGEAPVLGRK